MYSQKWNCAASLFPKLEIMEQIKTFTSSGNSCPEACCREGWHLSPNCLRSPGIDSKESFLPAYVAWRTGTTNTVGLWYRPARILRVAESIPGILKRLKIRAQTSSPRPFPSWYVDISFKDDVTVVLLLCISFMPEILEEGLIYLLFLKGSIHCKKD
jgi:hypothetical protein